MSRKSSWYIRAISLLLTQILTIDLETIKVGIFKICQSTTTEFQELNWKKKRLSTWPANGPNKVEGSNRDSNLCFFFVQVDTCPYVLVLQVFLAKFPCNLYPRQDIMLFPNKCLLTILGLASERTDVYHSFVIPPLNWDQTHGPLLLRL